MELIAGKPSHTKETFLYATAKGLERASYYGVRALIIIYMIDAAIGMTQDEAYRFYGWLATALLISEIVGGVLGDLLIGNKRALLIGGSLQALGTFVLCIPSAIGLYIGIGLIIIGSGLFTPNVIAQFGKIYLDRTKSLDGGFTILYTLINIGAFLGVLVISLLGEKNFIYGFAFAGILSVVAVVLLFLAQDKPIDSSLHKNGSGFKGVLYVALAIIVVSFFWGIYELFGGSLYFIQYELSQNFNMNSSRNILQSIGSGATIIIGIIVAILWSFLYTNRILKLGIGFLTIAIAMGLLLLIPEYPDGSSIPVFIIALLFIGAAEIIIAPTINSIITKYSNPKYLAIIFSVAFIPIRIFYVLSGFIAEHTYQYPKLPFIIGCVIYTLLFAALIILFVVLKNTGKTHLANQSQNNEQ